MYRQLRPETVYYVFGAARAFAGAMFVACTIYFVNVVKMDPLQLVLVGTVVESAYFLFEVPTGIVADVYSRRLSVIIGVFIIGAAWVLEGSVPVFGSILAAQAVWAAGEAFLSGATQAWLADEVGEGKVGPVFIRSGQVNRVVFIAATFLAVALAGWRLNVPIIAAGIILLALGVFMVCFMGESGFKPLPRTERNNWKTLFTTFKQGIIAVRASTILVIIFLASLAWGVSSEGYDRLWEAHFLTGFTFPEFLNLKPVTWFGIISVGSSLMSLIVTETFRRRLEKVSQNPTAAAGWLMGLSILTFLAGIGLALTGNFFLALTAILVHSLVGSVSIPLYDAWLVRHIPPEVRATVISIMGQSNSIGQIAGGPGIGAVGKIISIRAALVISALFYLPVPFLYGRAARKKTE